jgi:hypothetical protein
MQPAFLRSFWLVASLEHAIRSYELASDLSTSFCSLLQEYTQLFVNWWRHYYDMIEQPLPQEPRHMALLAAHDISDSWKRWSERSFVASGCGFNASVGKVQDDAAMR